MFVVNVEAAIYRDDVWLVIRRSLKESHAAGMISLVGGKVEHEGNQSDILERTLRREIAEEVGIEVSDAIHYVHSTSFVADDGDNVIDVVFLCEYLNGEAVCKSPDEVDAVLWLPIEQVLGDDATPPWTKESLKLAHDMRKRLGS
ncbi:NUDIX domain-containing protein [Alicyclobacillus sp. TC]|uniref:NUDIX domain-containing protein n=1 Tax=Alicyclobacillus tolerans TaxID=90970 RepID=A0A1M6R5G0_9BACL|nr:MULTISPECIES: NUDIX domain-containing protein [Alicyclobacillus]QRF22416.1 NUDIX domain-containing protein [Alicyclobacillus sp. TC]SHK27578.1 NUDIX domain-containing protein [Alicyclobacillus montanus]